MKDEFRELLVATLPQLRSFALLLTRDRAAAEDLLQESALKAWRARAQFALGTDIKGWLYCIVRNEHINIRRRTKAVTVPIEAVPEAVFGRESNQEATTYLNEIWGAIGELPAKNRQILSLHCAAGLSYQEVADAMNCTMATVKSRLWRARGELQLALADKAKRQHHIAIKTCERDEAAVVSTPESACHSAQRGHPFFATS